MVNPCERIAVDGSVVDGSSYVARRPGYGAGAGRADGGENNVFTQIGLVVLVGLASENAILIVEFAREREAGGVDPVTAAIGASRTRLRPILMTSIAFIMGVVRRRP